MLLPKLLADEDWKLLLGWLVAALNPAGPYPVLVLLGEQGTAKSTTAELVRSVFDPVVAGRRALPKTERDLMISASSSWALLLDNLTKVTQEQSNALCRLATGGGFATRELWTDRGEVVFDLCRPVLITGIDVAGLGEDLRERSMILELPLIQPQTRREERYIRARFEAEHPQILGALLDAASCALRRRDEVALDASPRMADAASWMDDRRRAGARRPGRFHRPRVPRQPARRVEHEAQRGPGGAHADGLPRWRARVHRHPHRPLRAADPPPAVRRRSRGPSAHRAAAHPAPQA